MSDFKQLRTLVLLLLFVPVLCSGAEVALDPGSEVMGGSDHRNQVKVADITGLSSDASYSNYIGHLGVLFNQFKYFLTIDFPLAVEVAPSSNSGSPLVLSADRRMTLAWTDGANKVPVQYNVYFGSDTAHLPLVTTLSTREFLVRDLDYARSYFWRINSFDQYGRNTDSRVFSFSIAPPLTHFYCAPNPFRAGRESTTFIYSAAQGEGSIKVFALPHGDLVYSATVVNPLEGTNTWVYDGRDGNGATLYNGVYMAILESPGHGKQKFKFMVVK